MLCLQLAILVLVACVQGGSAAAAAKADPETTDCKTQCTMRAGTCLTRKECKAKGEGWKTVVMKCGKGKPTCKCCINQPTGVRTKKQPKTRKIPKNASKKNAKLPGTKSREDGIRKKKTNKKVNNDGSPKEQPNTRKVPPKKKKNKNNRKSKGEKAKGNGGNGGKGRKREFGVKGKKGNGKRGNVGKGKRGKGKGNGKGGKGNGKGDSDKEKGPAMTCYRCKTWDTGDVGAIYDPKCNATGYSDHTDKSDASDNFKGCATKVYKNGDVVRLFEPEEIKKPRGGNPKGKCYEGTDYENGGPEYQYTRCWCSGDNCNTNLCEECA